VQFFLINCCALCRENNKYAGMGERSMRRNTAVIGMAPDLDPATWDHSELDKYGLGKGERHCLSALR